jgi:hypothetical protein
MGAVLPISIATAQAIESSLGVLPDNEVPKAPILNADSLWVNVRTLYRNLMGSIERDQRDGLVPDDLAEAIINEMQIIEAAISQGSNGLCNVVYYVCSYDAVPRRFPHANHKNPNTDNAKYAWNMEQLTMKAIADLQPAHDLRQFDLDFDKEESRVFIITHYPVDLLNRYMFRTLTLVESHTGTLKSPARWYTKLGTGPSKELYNIPFDRMTLQLFGDGVLFSPHPIKIRRFLMGIAEKYKWSSISTKALVMAGIKAEKDPVLEGFILKLY